MADYRDLAAALGGGYGQDTGGITPDTLITLKNGKTASAGDLLGMLKGFGQAVGSNLESLGRGGVASVIGAGGDLESFGRMGINKLYGAGGVNVNETPVLPTTTDILGMMPRGTATRPETAGMEELGGYMTPATAKVLKPAVVATGRLAGQEIANVASGMPSRSLLGDITPKPKQIFIGENAQTWNKTAADQAVQMEKAGARPEDIWAATGTFRGAEGKLRQEISDLPAIFREDKLPEVPSLLNVATQYLRDKGVITNPNRDIASIGVPEELRKEAIDYAQNKLQLMEKPKTLLGNVFEHPELLKAYPDLANIKVGKETSSNYRGMYNPEENTITTGGGLIGGADQSRSTMLHELQHAIQQKEGMAKGGNPTVMPNIIRRQWSEELEPYRQGNSNFERNLNKLQIASGQQYINKLDKLSVADNIKPSQVFRFADWYKYSGDVREALGKMPERKSFARDEWLRRAAQIMKQKVIEDRPSLTNYTMDDREANNLYRAASRGLEKTRKDAQAFDSIQNKYQELYKMPNEESYMHLAGEAEARATQQRLPLSEQERLAKYPYESYDRPKNKLLITK
jgi:2-oxo-4-hydroxy-4-carboxy--5-ureidoimidazoline (OHCU) decarboxylase